MKNFGRLYFEANANGEVEIIVTADGNEPSSGNVSARTYLSVEEIDSLREFLFEVSTGSALGKVESVETVDNDETDETTG